MTNMPAGVSQSYAMLIGAAALLLVALALGRLYLRYRKKRQEREPYELLHDKPLDEQRMLREQRLERSEQRPETRELRLSKRIESPRRLKRRLPLPRIRLRRRKTDAPHERDRPFPPWGYVAFPASADEASTGTVPAYPLGPPAPPPPRLPPQPPPRYANVSLLGLDSQPLACVEPQETACLRVEIAALRPESLVADPIAFPEEVLPAEDVVLSVILSSSDFAVGLRTGELEKNAVVEQRMRLPVDGGAAVAEDGSEHIDFLLRAPPRTGQARARLSYLYRNTVLQSQRLDASLGVDIQVTTDFTISTGLGADVQLISKRPRVTVIANESPGAMHELTVRAGDANGAPIGDPIAFQVQHQRIGPTVAQLRRRLAREAPETRRQSKQDLVRTLRRLAPLGWDLYAALDPKLQAAVREVAGKMEDAVLQVALAQGSTFTWPWSFVYDIYLPSGASPEELPVCKLISEWDGRSPMVAEGTRRCPHEREETHSEGVLCPFGFWGYRHSIEVLTSAERPAREIRWAQGSQIVVAETERGVDKGRLARHGEALTRAFASVEGGLELRKARTVAQLRELIEEDRPIVYFLCHGERKGVTTWLAIGDRERIGPQDLIGWIDVAATRGRHMWTDPQPLVFINACGSAEITPDDLVDYLGAFVGKGKAVGVVGTEVKVEQTQAMELAESFFAKLFERDATVDAAMRHVRTEFLAEGNMFGLMYTSYCFADLAVARSGIKSPSASVVHQPGGGAFGP